MNLPELPSDAFTVNFVRLAGLDKHKARECEAIAREVVRAHGEACFRAGMERAAVIADSYTKHHVRATAHHFDRWIEAEKYHAARMDAGSQIRDAIRSEIGKNEPIRQERRGIQESTTAETQAALDGSVRFVP